MHIRNKMWTIKALAAFFFLKKKNDKPENCMPACIEGVIEHLKELELLIEWGPFFFLFFSVAIFDR